MKQNKTSHCLVFTLYSSAQLPDVIDADTAVTAFVNQRGCLLDCIQYCLPTLANSLYAKCLIPKDVYWKSCDEGIERMKRCVHLLNCIEDRIKWQSSDFKTFVDVIKSEPSHILLAQQLVESYCE